MKPTADDMKIIHPHRGATIFLATFWVSRIMPMTFNSNCRRMFSARTSITAPPSVIPAAFTRMSVSQVAARRRSPSLVISIFSIRSVTPSSFACCSSAKAWGMDFNASYDIVTASGEFERSGVIQTTSGSNDQNGCHRFSPAPLCNWKSGGGVRNFLILRY